MANDRSERRCTKYTAVDLFAGIGGIRMGFEEGFDGNLSVDLVSEIDESARKAYRSYFGESLDIREDVKTIELGENERFDICMAGFPCQAFSNAGKRLGFADEARGTLFYEVARLCEGGRFRVIFCENVKGLVSHDGGRTMEIIKGTLAGIGYSKQYIKVLNSRDFGVPQNRERVYIVAFRDDVDDSGFGFPEPLGDTPKLKTVLENEPVDPRYYISQQYLDTLRRHRARHELRGNGFGYVVRDVETDCSGALVCGGMGRERNMIVDTRTELPEVNESTGRPYNREHLRFLTPKEWANLQGFPEDYEIVVPKGQAYRQLGNTVTVPVVREIAKRIRSVLDGQSSKTTVSDSSPTRDTT